MARGIPTRVALVWSQFAAHHADRCIATAERLAGRAEVLAVEVATTSREYAAFPPSGETGAARKRTLFPGRSFDEVPRWLRFLAVLNSLRACRMVCIGVPYSHLEFVVLAWLLRLLGKRVVLLSDSKFDDFPRASGFEVLKALGLSCFSAAMVAGARGADYFRFLGFRRRPVLPGCDTVSIERVRREAASGPANTPPAFAERDFVFVGRFIAKKNLFRLIEGHALYCRLAGDTARRLVLIGSGPLEESLRREAAAGITDGRVVFAGFLSGASLYQALGRALGLVLVSTSEQWGLVVNEALAMDLPVIASEAPGARDLLVRDGVNGLVVENGSIEGIARAMLRLAADEGEWLRMRENSRQRAWLGDAERFADAIELLLDPATQPARDRMDACLAELAAFRGRPDQPWSLSPKSTERT